MGYLNDSEVVRVAIMNLYNQAFRSDSNQSGGPIQIERKKPGRPSKTDDEKREEKKKEKQSICEQLGGEVKGDTCHYYTYSLRDRFEQEVPVSVLNDSHLNNQYDPSKEEIKALQKAGKVNYRVDE